MTYKATLKSERLLYDTYAKAISPLYEAYIESPKNDLWSIYSKARKYYWEVHRDALKPLWEAYREIEKNCKDKKFFILSTK